MLERAWAAGLELAWVLGDEVYSDFRTRWLLEARGQPYVLAVSSNQRVWSGGYQVPVAELADACLEPDWWLWRVADGAKGPRQYEWAAGRIGSSMDERLVHWLAGSSQLPVPERAGLLPVCCLTRDRGPTTRHSCRPTLAHRVLLRNRQAGNWLGRV